MSVNGKSRIHQIELRSDEMQEILGKPPRRILRWGITLIFIVIIALVVGSWFFRYPELITASVEVTSENPPVYMVSRVNGKIDKLFVRDKQAVDSGQILVILENPADYRDVFLLKDTLTSLDSSIRMFDTTAMTLGFLHQVYALGGLQEYYGRFVSALQDYVYFLRLDYYDKKIETYREELSNINLYYDRIYRRKIILEEDLELSSKDLNRYKLLYDSSVIALSDLEKMRSSYLQKELSLEEARSELANTKIQVTQLEQSILDLELLKRQREKELQINTGETFENLLSQIEIWENDYMIRSPIKGIASFNKYWTENQNVTAGDKVIAVVSEKENRIIGKVNLSTRRAGKVKTGQQVNVKLQSYPYIEFGMVRGVVDNISLVPSEENFYMLEISFPEGLKTNYGVQIEFSQRMQGQAEIITEEIPLLIRIIRPFKSLIKNKSIKQL